MCHTYYNDLLKLNVFQLLCHKLNDLLKLRPPPQHCFFVMHIPVGQLRCASTSTMSVYAGKYGQKFDCNSCLAFCPHSQGNFPAQPCRCCVCVPKGHKVVRDKEQIPPSKRLGSVRGMDSTPIAQVPMELPMQNVSSTKHHLHSQRAMCCAG